MDKDLNKPEQKIVKKKKRIKHPILCFFLCLVILLSVGSLIFVNYYFKHLTGSTIMECKRDAKKVVENSTVDDFNLNKTSYIYGSDGSVIATLSDGASSNYLPYDKIPKDVINAFIAVEDQTFWDNPGFDIKGMLRVLLNYVRTDGTVAQGASTITQQLSRTVFLSTEKSMERKVREIFISYYLTKKYSKEQIMEFYVNNCCFANSVYGIQDASETYLGKSASQLTLLESAYLCAIPNRPEYYNPFNNSSNAVKRCNKILNDMISCGFITEDDYKAAAKTSITIIKNTKKKTIHNYPTTYAIKCAVEYLMRENDFNFKYKFDTKTEYKEYKKHYNEVYKSMEYALITGGYKIYTSLDVSKCDELQSIIDQNLNFDTEMNAKTDDFNLQAATTVIDNDTHKVVAIVGGRSQVSTVTTYSLNRAFQSERQPGSTIKPLIVYTPALMNDIAEPTTRLKNINVTYAYEHPDKISVMRGSSVSLRSAVEQSLNGCALYLFDQVTPRRGLSYLQDMTFANIVPDDMNLSSGLGGLTYGTTTEEMANAYSTLANHGNFVDATCIVSMIDSTGKEVYQEPSPKRVYSTLAADTMTDIMKGVILRGTAARMGWRYVSDLPAAGKTGTTNSLQDGWFCGFTPYYTIAVWVGNDDHTEVNNLYGGTYPASIWKDSMLYMTQLKPERDFDLLTID